MPRSNRRAATRRGPDRRILGAAAALVVFGGIIGVTQISNADTGPTGQPAAQTQAAKQINGLDVLATTCEDSTLAPHDGFQKGDRCVSTEFGEVGSAANNPSLLITSAPRAVTVNTPFQLKVSTRNLIRDRFLAAGKGGYYVESSVLQDGIVRGHFHTACRMLTSTKTAPAPDPVPAFFVATEDKQGGKTPDTVTISVPGLPTTGTAQCASWAGDGSHRIPMMERANQTPALDAVRIQVRAGQQGGGGVQPGSGQSGSGGAVPTPTTTSGPTSPPKTQPTPSATSGPTPPKTQPTPSATSGPTPPAKPQPITKSTVTRSTTAPAAPAGAGTQTAARGSNNADAAPPESTDAAPADSADRTTADGADQTTAPEPTTTSRKATKKAAKAEPVSTDEAVEEQDASPDSAQPAAQEQDQQTTDAAKPAAANKPLALTGINTLAIIGGGAILLTIGVFVLSTSRRRRVHHWRG